MRRRGRKQISARQAISTKYLGPTNTLGTRIKASSGSGSSVTVPYDYSLDAFANHQAAAEALCKKLKWTGTLVGGGTADGYCFVFRDD